MAGIPVAVLGLVGYGGLLVTAIVRGTTAAAVGLGLALVAVVFSAYLLVAQLALIHAVCQWCVASEVVILLITALAAWRYFAQSR